jgi:hypothetical protein
MQAYRFRAFANSIRSFYYVLDFFSVFTPVVNAV